MARTRPKTSPEVTLGSANVFADLGFTDAEDRQTKLRLAFVLNEALKERRVTQVEAASILRLNQPKISALQSYKLDGFSVERLMTLLTALDRDVDIVVRRKARARTAARITVVTA